MTLIDSNILIDILSSDRVWLQWSMEKLIKRSDFGPLIIDDIIYAEIATQAASQGGLDENLRDLDIQFNRIPKQALFAAAKAFQRYRATGGSRPNVLPDFFIGAHAQVTHTPILTRDTPRYRTYFPDVELITPEN
jgi:predicted nucleic acid-binding protein